MRRRRKPDARRARTVAAVLLAATIAAVESDAMCQCAADLARLTGEPLQPLLLAASAPMSTPDHRALRAWVDRCIEAASADRPDLASWSQTVAWLERYGVPA